MRKLSFLLFLSLFIIPSLFAQDPGTNTEGIPLTTPELGSIIPLVTETGFISLSVDGLGTNIVAGGIIQVDKPAGATVRGAYFAAASTGFSNRIINNGHITIDGTGVNWSITTPSSIASHNHWADVTSIVKSKIDLAPAGLVDFLITEVQTGGIDGEILAVIFDDPNQTTSNTIILLFGAQNVSGDNFAIALANPLDLSDPNLVLDLCLGISFGFQPANQFSIVEVDGTRMTTSAGGQDDGVGANGALLTVGGIGDLNDNPALPFQTDVGGPRYDDELYNLIPFVTDGATAINVFTQNPSNDDNIFFACLFLGATTAIVGEGILLTPLIAANPVNTQHTVTATVQDNFGNPIVGRNANFEIVNGPNVGLTGSDITDANGEATFTYASSIVGVDEIVADMLDSQQNLVTSNSVIKEWTSDMEFPFMTIWAVNDDVDGALQYYTLELNNNFLNIEGNILGVQGPKDIEDLKIDGDGLEMIDGAGTFYFVNNVGTSTIYKFSFSELDGDENTVVPATLVGSTGLPANPNGNSGEEISSLLFYNDVLYGLSKETKKLYSISKVDGSIILVATLSVAGDFRSDGMTMREGIVYLLKTNDTGGESEIWKFDQFPGGSISYVRQIETSGKVEALTAHPDGFLYASDEERLYQISVTNSDIGFLADYTVDIEGMDFFFELEELLPTVPRLQFIPIISPVPVELESFTAEAKSGKVILNWQTATEVNNYGFEIHRQTNDDEWVTLGFVEGHGNSNSPKRYVFTDGNPTGGSKFKYRLKQVDNDGTYEYSEIVEVEFIPTEFALYQNYPNPFNPATTIKFETPIKSNIVLRVFNALGEEVVQLVNEEKPPGIYELEFDATALPSGIYFYSIQAGDFIETKKMILMK